MGYAGKAKVFSDEVLLFQGIDGARNLIDIGSELCGHALIAGDYLEVQPDQRYDLIVCDFGFDRLT